MHIICLFVASITDAGKKFQLANVKDINTAKGTEYVVGMGKGIVYRYDKNGVNAVFPIKSNFYTMKILFILTLCFYINVEAL